VPEEIRRWLAHFFQKGASTKTSVSTPSRRRQKALKALYLSRGWVFRYVHDLEELITGLRQHRLAVPAEIEDVVVLTSYALEARYPSLGEPVAEEEYRQALNLAERVVHWVESLVGSTSP
jgi:HEPN domain-containing protein